MNFLILLKYVVDGVTFTVIPFVNPTLLLFASVLPRSNSNYFFERMIEILSREMKQAAKLLEFEQAAFLRDKINKLKEELEGQYG